MKIRPNLRARATMLGTLAFAVLLAVGSVLLVQTLESRLTAASDQLSRSRVDDLLSLARNGALPRSLRNVDGNGIAQVVTAEGRVLAASPNITGQPPVARLHPGEDAQTSTFQAPDDQEIETYRFWYASGPSPDGRVTVYVGNSLEAVSEASLVLRWALGLGVPVVVVLLGLAIWLLLGRVIGRLDRIRAEVDRITEENLDRRVAGDGVDDEVGRLAATMNAMLERLDVAARRQRDFVADVSHDLQSPLTAQRVALEVALAGPDSVDKDRLRDEVLAATADMERLVGDLLELASIDAHKAASPAYLDLDTIALEEAARARSGSAAEVDTGAVSAAPVYADAADVRRIVRNLLDNAAEHADSRVRLVVDSADVDGRTCAQLLVVDDGPGVPVEHRDKIFDRFYRAETARSRSGGSGLGLSIARELAERNGGCVDLVEDGPGTTMRLRLPLLPPSQ